MTSIHIIHCMTPQSGCSAKQMNQAVSPSLNYPRAGIRRRTHKGCASLLDAISYIVSLHSVNSQYQYVHAKLHNVTHASGCNKKDSASPSINMESSSTCIKRTSVPERYIQENKTADRDRNESSWVRVGGWFSSSVTQKYKKGQGNEVAMSQLHGSDKIQTCRLAQPCSDQHVQGESSITEIYTNSLNSSFLLPTIWGTLV